MRPMPPEKLACWIQAAELPHHSATIEQRVIRAGEFLEITSGLSEEDACQLLPSIDYSQPITVARLPDSVYIRCQDRDHSAWFTDTGLTAEMLKEAGGPRSRSLYRPLGNIAALKSSARDFKDSWEPRHLFHAIATPQMDQFSRSSRHGGNQFMVLNTTRMRDV